jgi:hypothetical protein
LVLSLVALVLAWSVDAGITRRRFAQRRRTKKELRFASRELHRRVATLRLQAVSRRLPKTRALIMAALTWAIVTVTAVAMIAIIERTVRAPVLASAALFFGVFALWSTLWAVTLTAAIAFPGSPPILRGVNIAAVAFLVGFPTALFIWPSVERPPGLSVAVVAAAILPFAHTVGSPSHPLELRSAFVAVELRRWRKRRL